LSSRHCIPDGETKPKVSGWPEDEQENRAMKLSSASLERTRDQVSAQPIPDGHPVMSQLTNIFGEHTFFLDEEGLLIVEPTSPTRSGIPAGRLVKLASWNDAERKSLAPHVPETTDVVVELARDAPPD
jgi:hypothetical protein